MLVCSLYKVEIYKTPTPQSDTGERGGWRLAWFNLTLNLIIIEILLHIIKLILAKTIFYK
jgi:hypothetical protein